MSTKLYVGNLSFQTSSADLQELFAQAGTVQSVEIVEDAKRGRSRGFGWIEMSSLEEAKIAIKEFHGKEFCGQNIVVLGGPHGRRKGPRGSGGPLPRGGRRPSME